MVEPMLSDIKKSRAYQEIAQEAKQEGWQQGIEEGRKAGQQEGMQKGRQEGKDEQVRQIATAMLKKNLSLELIVEITGISQEEILAISKELAHTKN